MKTTKRTKGSIWGHPYQAWLMYGISAFVLMLMQNAPNFFPSIYYARPTPLVLFVVCVAMFEGPRLGAAIGVFSGLLWDLYSERLFGFTALQLLFFGVIVALLIQWLLRTNFISCMLLCILAVFLQMTIEWFFRYVLFMNEESLTILWRVYLPNALYTVALAPLIYWIVFSMARHLRRRQMN